MADLAAFAAARKLPAISGNRGFSCVGGLTMVIVQRPPSEGLGASLPRRPGCATTAAWRHDRDASAAGA
jgi:hypothetical protein